ncbi:Putative aflatoxin regulatory protein [Colletotrichum destructivum]|uniref:Aflatoxin regulatory protein n=1 Tax=Colletotrichum destructivum TaxID=34406 RepID=A0AAX4I0A2_9PEZI|nr:Putative aflatoxin regulatory protein [Colletotrichum destructivum]
MPDHRQAHRTRPVCLRLACDACSTTKVKCDKACPACQRCVDNGLYCAYSNHSQSQSHNQSQGQSQIDCWLSVYPQEAVLTAALLAAPRSLSQGPDPMGSFSICPDAADVAAGSWDDLNFALSGDHLHALEPFVVGGDGHYHEHEHIDSPWMSQLEEEEGSPGAILFAGMPKQQRPEHDCENRASNLLRSLHYDPNLFAQVKQIAAADMPLVDGDGPVTIPSVDKIILASRVALATLPDLFDCPCSRYPHMALLGVAILSKVLFWYRVAICAPNTRRQPSGADETAVLGQQQQQQQQQQQEAGLNTSGSSAP